MTPGPDQSTGPAGALLRWGVKRPFLQYVAGLPDGGCSVTDGAVLAPGPVFVFQGDGHLSPGSAGGPRVHRYRGALRFAAHMGFLRVRIADPWLEFVGTTGRLSAVDVGPEPASRLPLVTFWVESLDGDGEFREPTCD